MQFGTSVPVSCRIQRVRADVKIWRTGPCSDVLPCHGVLAATGAAATQENAGLALSLLQTTQGGREAPRQSAITNQHSAFTGTSHFTVFYTKPGLKFRTKFLAPVRAPIAYI